MDLGKTIRTAHSALKRQGIAHALIGGFALSVHNVARATEDVDLLANRPLSQAMLTTAPADNDLNIPCVTAEDIIGLKIQAYKNDPQRRLRDQADIQALIEENQSLDWKKIKMYADLFDAWADIEAIRDAL